MYRRFLVVNNSLNMCYEVRCTHIAFHVIAQTTARNGVIETIAARIVNSIDAVVPVGYAVCAVPFSYLSPFLFHAWLFPAIHAVERCDPPKVAHCEGELSSSLSCVMSISVEQFSKSVFVSLKRVFATSAASCTTGLQFLGENYALFATRATAEPPCASGSLGGTNRPADNRQSSVGLACAINERRHDQTLPYEWVEV
jgi:hypothetical protein